MEEKRRTATKKAIEEYRTQYPEFTDEYIAELVQDCCAVEIDNPLDAGIKGLKELYRRGEELTDESLIEIVDELVEDGKIKTFDEMRYYRAENKVQKALKKIYKTAQTTTIYLSDFPELATKDALRYIEQETEYDMTMAQKMRSLLLDTMDVEQLPFHCYGEPNGDVVFTLLRRTIECYDEDGNPKYSQKELEEMLREAEEQRKKDSELGVWPIIMMIIMVSVIVLLIATL